MYSPLPKYQLPIHWKVGRKSLSFPRARALGWRLSNGHFGVDAPVPKFVTLFSFFILCYLCEEWFHLKWTHSSRCTYIWNISIIYLSLSLSLNVKLCVNPTNIKKIHMIFKVSKACKFVQLGVHWSPWTLKWIWF